MVLPLEVWIWGALQDVAPKKCVKNSKRVFFRRNGSFVILHFPRSPCRKMNLTPPARKPFFDLNCLHQRCDSGGSQQEAASVSMVQWYTTFVPAIGHNKNTWEKKEYGKHKRYIHTNLNLFWCFGDLILLAMLCTFDIACTQWSEDLTEKIRCYGFVSVEFQILAILAEILFS